MNSVRKLIVVFTFGAAGVAILAIWVFSNFASCEYKESSPTYSPDKKVFTQMQFTICRDNTKSHARLVMGSSGTRDQAVILDLRPSLETLRLNWTDGPELHVHVPESAIAKRYGPYDTLPPVVVENP